jgi:DUF971 family protein
MRRALSVTKNANMAVNSWPTELRVSPARDTLTVGFDSGEHFTLRAEYLRVESPSAEVRGHGGGPKQVVRGKEDVKIAHLEPVGNYAVRIVFDDGHDSGLYGWDFLLKLGREHDRIWAAHLAAAKP